MAPAYGRLALILALGGSATPVLADVEGSIPSFQGSDWAPIYFNTDGSSGDQLGDAVATSGEWLLIGESRADGAVASSGTAWAMSWNEDSLAYVDAIDLGDLVPASDLAAGSEFGRSLDIDGSYAIVGAPSCSLDGVTSGRAFLFQYDGSIWSHVFTFADGGASGQYGFAVDITGSQVAIGEPGDGSNAGFIHVYEITTAFSGTEIISRGGLTARRAAGDRWGESVDRAGDLLVGGAPGNGGYAAIYEQLGDGSYVIRTMLSPPSDLSDPQARFGQAVAIDASTVIVGAPWPEAGDEDRGGVVVYQRDSVTAWIETARLDDDLTPSNGRFGESLDIHDDLIVVGIPADNPAGDGSGSAQIFRYSPTSDIWVLEHDLLGFDVRASDRFGDDVAVGPYGVAVGALYYDTPYSDDAGVAFTYRQMPWDDDNWQHDIRMIRPCLPSGQLIDNPLTAGTFASFGRDVALDGNTAIIGDPYAANELGDPGGSVTFLTRSAVDADWIALSGEDVSLPLGIAAYEYFGESVAIDGDFAIVGAPGYDEKKGRAIIMRRNGTSWFSADTLLGDEAGADFGTDVAVETAFGKTYFMVGAPGFSSSAGQVSVYQWDDFDEVANKILTIVDPQWAGTGTNRFGQSVDLQVTAGDSLRLAVGNPYQFDNNGSGSVSLFQATDTGFLWTFGNYINLRPYADIPSLDGNYCAFNLDLDGPLLIVGMPLSSGFKDQSGAAAIYTVTDSGGETDVWNLAAVLASEDPGNSELAGHDVAIDAAAGIAVLGVPGSNYAETNAGGVLPFVLEGSTWRQDVKLISHQPLNEMSAGTSVALDGTSVLAGAPRFQITEQPPHPPHVLSWELISATAYQDPEEGSMGSDNSWTEGVGGEGDALFSLWLADPYVVPFDVTEWVGSIRIELDQITLDLLSGIRTVTDAVGIAGVTELRSGALTLESGTLRVQADVSVGRPDGYGQITLGDQGLLEVVDDLTLTADSGTSLTLNQTPEAKITVFTQAPTINGSMRVELGPDLDAAGLAEGDRFVLISSGVAPETLDVTALILPGLAEGLAFQVSYGAPADRRGRGGCPAGQLADCFGNCFPAGWIGDGFCDDGSYDFAGQAIYLDCASLGCDGDDCVDCWDDGGEWEMALEVVSLAGLLEFGDPNAVFVEGDPTAIEVVDLTDDGAEEVCVTFAGAPGQLYIFENDGAGGIAQQVILNTGDQPVDLTSGDFDDDGRTDLAVANNLGQTVDIYYNDDNDVTNGFLLLAPSLDVGAPPTCLAGINMNLDGVDDLVVGLEDTDGDGNGFLAIYLGSPSLRGGGMSSSGGITPTGTPLGVDPSEEEDQKDFLFVSRLSSGKTTVGKREAAARTFNLIADEYVVGADPGGIALGDLNGDGRTDIAVTSTANGTVAILLQSSTGNADFLSPAQIPLGDEPTGITAVDFDEDGNLDLAVVVDDVTSTGVSEPVVRVLQSDGALTFTTIDLAEGENVVLIDSGDVSGSGVPELVTIGGGNNLRRGGSIPAIALRELESAPACPGDANADGVVDVQDLLIVLAEYSECTTACNGDFDADDDVDIDDLLVVIGRWGDCDAPASVAR